MVLATDMANHVNGLKFLTHFTDKVDFNEGSNPNN
jgi:hypothetical protein